MPLRRAMVAAAVIKPGPSPVGRRLRFDHAWLVTARRNRGPPDWRSRRLDRRGSRRGQAGSPGMIVSSNTFRNPALLLKEAVTVDHISEGRLTLGIGTGWHEDEHRRYGIELPPPPERVDRFEEAVEIITLLMAQESTTFTGDHYRLADARLRPPPVQQPRIPILIAAHRPRMLRLAARYADPRVGDALRGAPCRKGLGAPKAVEPNSHLSVPVTSISSGSGAGTLRCLRVACLLSPRPD